MKIDLKKLVHAPDKVIEYSFYFLAIAVPLVFSPQNYEIFEFPKQLLVYAGAAVVLTFWSIKILVSGKLNFSPTPLSRQGQGRQYLFLPILAFFTSQIIATIFSIDLITSLFGYYSRFNGSLLSTAAYIVLFFAAVSNLTKRSITTILFLFVSSAFLASIWGIPSHFGFDPTCKLITGVWTSKCWSADFDPTLRIFATFGQPNWMAGFLIMAILVLIGLTLAISKIKFQVLAIIVNSILFWAFLLTNSRSAAVALLIPLFIFTGICLFLKFQQKFKFPILPLALTIASFGILTGIFGQQLLGRLEEVEIPITSQSQSGPYSAASDAASQGKPTESGQIRLIVWQGALGVWQKHPLTGSGVETFGYSYYQSKPAEHNLTTEWNFLYNKAHNEFLNYLSTTGILGLASYLAIILTYLILTTYYLLRNEKLKTKNEKLLVAGLLSALISFLIHNFFGFSVVPTTLFFWMILASSMILISTQQNSLLKEKPIQPKFKPLLILLPIGFLIFAFVKIFNFYLADLSFAKGLANYEIGNYSEAAIDFDKAINLSPLPQSLFLAHAAYNLAILSQADKNLIQDAENLAKIAGNIAKFNLITQRLVTNTYLELTSYNLQFLEKTEKATFNLLKIAPTDAETHFQVGQILNILGKDEEAKKIIKKAIELKPDYQEAIDTLAQWQQVK